MAFIAFSTSLAGTVVAILKVLCIAVAGVPTSVPLVLIIGAVILALQMPFLGSLAVIPYIYILNIFTFFGLTKKDATWCVAYDSVTKLPIDPAYITVRDMQGREVTSLITDLSGRFTLLLERGLYTLEASKTNYIFPSAKLSGDKNDGKYSNLYFGSVIEIDDEERAVTLSVPMDPVREDWNQVQKKRYHLFYRFDDTRTYFHAANTYAALSFVLALLRSFVYPSDIIFQTLEASTIIMVVLFLYTQHKNQLAHSVVLDKHTHLPVAFARINLYSVKTNNRVAEKITSFEGQFTCLVSKGTYYLTVERRNEHGKYDLIYTSSHFSVHDGYIGKRFEV